MLSDFPVHLYILCAVCTQDTFPKFDLYEAFYVKSAYFRRFGRKIKINRKFLGMLSHFPVHLYILCGVCTQDTVSKFDF